MPLLPIYVLSALTGVGIGIATPLIPLLLQQRGASGTAVGLAASVMFAAVGLAALATGRVADRRGPKPGMVAGSLLFGVALALMPLAPDYHWFLIVRAVEGLGIGILTVCLEAAINLLVTDRSRGKAMGMYSLLFAGGIAIGPSVGVLFPSGSDVPFWIAAAAAFAAGAVVMSSFRNVVAETPGYEMQYDGLIVRAWAPIVGVLCYALIEVTMLSLYPVYLSFLGLDLGSIGLLFGLYAGGAVVAPLIVGVISDRIRRELVMVACGLILAMSVGALWIVRTPAPLAAATVAIGLAAGAIYPTGLSILGDRVSRAQLGGGNSLYTTAYSLGSIIGPVSVGMVIDRHGASLMFAPLFAVAVAFVALMVVDAHPRSGQRHVVARA